MQMTLTTLDIALDVAMASGAAAWPLAAGLAVVMWSKARARQPQPAPVRIRTRQR